MRKNGDYHETAETRAERPAHAGAARALNIPSRVEKALELPVGSLSSAARIELSGNRRAVVEGCRGIVEYGG